jgi:hypothetical protein
MVQTFNPTLKIGKAGRQNLKRGLIRSIKPVDYFEIRFPLSANG